MSILCQYEYSTRACRFDTITNQNEIAERRINGLNVFGLCTRIVFGFSGSICSSYYCGSGCLMFALNAAVIMACMLDLVWIVYIY